MSEDDNEEGSGWTIATAVTRVPIDDDQAIKAALDQSTSEGLELRAAVADGRGKLVMIFSVRWRPTRSVSPVSPPPPIPPVPPVSPGWLPFE